MKKYLFLLVILCIQANLYAQDGFAIIEGPYLQNISENEATVVWMTNQDAVSWVELAPNDEKHFYHEERPQFYETIFGKKVIGKLHKVRITGLEKGTTYRYRIYSKEVTLQSDHYIQYGRVAASAVYQREPYRFRTLDQSVKQLSFVMVNDIHERSDLLERLLKPALPQNPDFVLFNGDMVTDLRSQQQMMDGFLSRSVELFATEKPFFFARGNHETRGTFSNEFINYFPTPTGQPYYAFRQGPAFFIMLDGGEDKPDSDVEYHGLAAFDQYRHDQTAWLKQTLESEEFRNAPVKIVVMHIPPVRSTWYGLTEVKKLFIPLLNEAGIDIMLSGHLHRHFYLDGKEEGCNFPILINSNEHSAFVRIDENQIRIDIQDDKGKPFKEISIPPGYQRGR